jgi:large subunit ribosomal protein L23
MSNATQTIKKPWVTEKATALGTQNKYVFLLRAGATKNEVKKAVQERYHVDVTAVNVVNRPPKVKRFRGRKNLRGGYRKAIVTIKQGQKIEVA